MEAHEARATGGSERRDDAETFEVRQLGAMEQPSWNAARLDDLSGKVDEGFMRMDARFAQVDARLDQIDAKFDRKFDRMQLTLITVGGGIIAALITTSQI